MIAISNSTQEVYSMTIVSKIIDKYTTNTKPINLLLNTQYKENIIKYISDSYFNIFDYKNISLFEVYDIYIVDLDKLETILPIYKKFLSKIVMVNHGNVSSLFDTKQNYNRLVSICDISMITADMELYLKTKNSYSNYSFLHLNQINQYLLNIQNEQ